MDTDNQLLASYVGQHSECAFRELVERHINLVHSAALRESRGDASLAEDITQAVFTELARRATELTKHPALAGWLYTSVRRMTANVRRAEDRRQHREQEALIMNELLGPDPTDQLWQQVRPVLDDVMHELNEADRAAVVLRFFEGRSFPEVGLALGLTENAARMRVERSLEKLHGLLSQRGVKSTASTLAVVLLAGAAMTAPSALGATVATSALETIAAGGQATVGLAKIFSLAKTKTAKAGALVIVATVGVLWHYAPADRPSPEAAAALQPVVPAVTVVAGDSEQNDPSLQHGALTNTSTSQMALQLVEAETGQPLAQVKLYLFYLLEDGRGKVVKAATDTAGKLGVDMPQAPYRALNLFVTADGHVPKVTDWGFKRAMPAEYTMKLERGITVGGVVVDEAGQPIAGAKVEFDGPGNDMSLPENIQFGPDTPTVTDPSGRWFCNMVPKEWEQISLLVTHPEHAETSATVRIDAAEANNRVITMPAGFTVAGSVQDSFGNPLEGAKVREVRMNSEGEHSKTTDATGTFEFKSMKPGELMLSVQAEGFAPSVQTIQVTGRVAALRFQLGPGQLLRGRVTDEEGNIITNAWVETTRRAIDKVKWSATTDAEGRFEWGSAPQEPLLYSFLAEGFNRVYALQLEADGSDHEIKLTRHQPDKDTVEITGTAVDADNGLPLDRFKVMIGEVDSDWSYPLEFGTAGKIGKFSLSFPTKSNHPYYQLRIEKEGYLPAVTASLSKKGGSKAFEFNLQKGSGPEGVVLLPGGEPVANATVLLCTPRSGVTIDGPAHIQTGLNTTTYRTQTDEAGKFLLPAAIAPQGIIVIHDQGYAELSLADLAATVNVTLQPWGRVDGRVMLDSRAAENERVVIYSHVARYDETGHRFTFVSFHLEAKTDSAGRFSFDKVPPGQCKVFRQELRSRTGFESHETSVAIKPGEPTEIVLGGTGRPITGTAVLQGATSPIDWKAVPVHLRLKTANEPGSRPKRDDFSSRDAYVEAMDRFFQAAEGQRRFGAFCNSDGSFRLPDVPAGTYELEIKVRDLKLNSISPHDVSDNRAAEIASLVREIIVPEVSGDHSDEPLETGLLELVASHETASAK